MTRYLMMYNKDHQHEEFYKVITSSDNNSWRELQGIGDPSYHYNNLRFFKLSEEIKRKGNE